MAQTSKSAQTGPAAHSTPISDSNGVITASHGPVGTAVNRKKQKRRQKQAAKAAAERDDMSSPPPLVESRNGHYHSPAAQLPPPLSHRSAPVPPGPEDPMAFQDDFDDEQYDTEEENQSYLPTRKHPVPNGYGPPPPPPPVANGTSKSSKKKKKNKSSTSQMMPQQHGHHATVHSVVGNRSLHHDGRSIWNTSTQEERERIKDFWLGLSENDRKSLVKIEKDAVLKKMKEQQKHSCSCTVCGRKRNAIEEELELLYDAYYEELEGLPPDRLVSQSHRPAQGRILGEELDEDDDLEEEEELDDEGEYSEDEYDDEEYSDEEGPELNSRMVPSEFLNFGNSLTVKGGILTVADDLLKNDGRKFIEMMEQLAERRMQREEEAQYAATTHPSSYQNYDHGYDGAPLDDDEFDEDEDEDYDSQDDYDEDEEHAIDTKTEAQRMEEGRRMFQIFAARMFEQRVLSAYREKVARERQQRLLDDLAQEQNEEVERAAKKAAASEKKKQKKQQAKQKQQEEKARKEAEKAAEEAQLKEAELKKQEDQRQKREEQRKKKELERKAAEEDKARKEAERFKRQQEERERQQEAERKAREQKAAEKKAKEDVKRKEREEREAREKEAKERKLQADRERKEREERSKSDREAQEKARKEAATAALNLQPPTQPAASRRATQPIAVPIPPGLQKQPSNVSSPHVPVATPALPKAPTPSRPRQASHQASKGSSPMTPQVPTGPSKSSSPASVDAAPQATFVPKSILQKPPSQISAGPNAIPGGPAMHPIQPPPGMNMSPGPLGPPGPPGFGPPPGVNGFHPMHSSMMPGIGQRGPFPPFGGQGMPFNAQHRAFGPPPGVPMPPPGIGSGPMDRPFDAPPGLPQQTPGLRQMSLPGFAPSAGHTSSDSSHSRQPSGTLDRSSFESSIAPTQPIGTAGPISRPAPIKRPSSVKTGDTSADSKGDVEELAKHLGSSALLDDSDEPFPMTAQDTRRTSAISGPTPGLSRGLSDMSTFSPFGGKPSQPLPFGLATPAIPSSPWTAGGSGAGVGVQTSFGSLGTNQSMWSTSPNAGWPSQSPLGFGGLGGPSVMANLGGSHRPRPQQIRLNVCNACRHLIDANQTTTPDGYIEVSTILRFMDGRGQLPTSAKEIIDICDTIGNADNGGGSFDVKQNGNGLPEAALIKFVASTAGMGGAPGTGPSPHGGMGQGHDAWGGVGQIGSPILGSHIPHGNTPFGSMRGGFPGLGSLN